MKSKKRTAMYIIWIVLGALLLGLGASGMIDEYWSQMGSALIFVSAFMLLKWYRVGKNEAYREKIEIENADERNLFIRNKAWAWTGYLFILIVSLMTIVFRILGMDEIAIIASYGVCLMLVIYWCSYWILRRKY